jgi:hypothetical protein
LRFDEGAEARKGMEFRTVGPHGNMSERPRTPEAIRTEVLLYWSGWKDTQDGRILRMGKRPNLEDAIARRQLIVSCIIFFILNILSS